MKLDIDLLPSPMGPGGRDMDDAAADEELLRHVRRQAGRRVTSVFCSGAFLRAAAGLLDGRRARCTGGNAGSKSWKALRS